jgi:poly-beta-1,6-N-acetyl-D-glucosamine N-deacetylase
VGHAVTTPERLIAIRHGGLSRRLRWNALGFVFGWSLIIVALVGMGEKVHVTLPSFHAGGGLHQAAPAKNLVLPAGPLAELRALPSPAPRQGPLVITYHNVEPSPRSSFSISPLRLQTELTLLQAAGYHSITAAQMLAWLDHGTPLPSKPVLITFDDGLTSAWQYADPILRDVGFKATSFVITGHVDNGSYYMTSAQIARLVRTGRWSFGAHTFQGHRYIRSGPGGTTAAFLVGRRWLPSVHRQETYAEFTRRVQIDTQRSLEWFAAHGLPRPQLFAYPFSAVSSPDHRAARLSDQILSRMFDARFLDDDGGSITSPALVRRHLFQRLDVLGTESPEKFAAEVAASTQLAPAETKPLRTGVWSRSSGRGQVTTEPSGLTLQPLKSTWFAATLAPTRTINWRTYGISTRAFLSTSENAAGISIPSAYGTASVSVSRSWYEVHFGDPPDTIADGRLRAAGSHWLRMRATAGTIVVAVDGQTVARLEVGARGGPSLFVDGPPQSTVQFSQIEVR